ncbi:MAG: hypothetical protein DI539_07510 [Flavobacterium psychrophilum]|nr:MAG: hypothetical protein DI539_07510 [Flavobacterium psychrophilum]
MTKFTLAVIVALLSLTAIAQSKKNSFAIFTECADAESFTECTKAKFEKEITGLISKEITADLEKSLDKNYFSITIAFISDEKGKVTPETIEIACDNKLLHKALKQYILNLPPFIPKDSSYTERRTVHIQNFTFIYNASLKKYESASNEKLLEEGINPDYVSFENEPVLKGCENESKEEAKKCTAQKLSAYTSKNIRIYPIPDSFSGTINLLGKFIVETDGSVTIDDITCSVSDCKDLIASFKKVIKKFPEFIPGNYKGVNIRIAYNLPLNVNVDP